MSKYKKGVANVVRGNREVHLPRITITTIATILLSGCSLAPDFKLPQIELPFAYKEETPLPAPKPIDERWQVATPLEAQDRGEWWKIFGDEKLNTLEMEATAANQSLRAAAARVEQARLVARSVAPSFLPDIGLGANAVRSQPSSAGVAAFGGQPGVQLKPYTLYSAQGVASYEVDLFGRVRDNYHAFEADAAAQAAAYRSALLALQADVAQHYFTLRAIDAELQLLRDTVKIRAEAARIMQKRFDVGEVGEQDRARTQAELAGTQADLAAVMQQRAASEHALAVLLGQMPSTYSVTSAPLEARPPEIPAGLPSALLQRRPDVAAAESSMAAANARIGVARSAFFPNLTLTASGGFESTVLSDLFQWGNRTWALGQLAGSALSMSIFNSGRDLATVDAAHAAYEASVADYRQSVLVAFRDVEDALSGQRLLAEQSVKADAAAQAASRTMELTQKRYDEGDADYFEVVTAQRDALAAGRAAAQTRGQRFAMTIALIRALGGGWDEKTIPPLPPEESRGEGSAINSVTPVVAAPSP